jgi:recombination protein RecR
MIKNRAVSLEPLLMSMTRVYENIKTCPICSNIDAFEDICSVCANPQRRKDIICIVESVADLWALERTSCFRGQYHILRGLLSSLEGNGPEVLLLDKLAQRCNTNGVTEIVIALSATLEGQTTDQYIRNFFADKNIKTTSLAHGIPVGGELDYLDDGTLLTAFAARQ